MVLWYYLEIGITRFFRLSFCLCFTFFILIFYFRLWGVPYFAFYLLPQSQFCLTFHITTRKHGICRPIFWKAHPKIACKTFFCLVDHSSAATSKVSKWLYMRHGRCHIGTSRRRGRRHARAVLRYAMLEEHRHRLLCAMHGLPRFEVSPNRK
jgi:hypothetical protein